MSMTSAKKNMWEKHIQQQGVGELWGDQIQPKLNKRPLKVGYLSSDLNRHPVGRFLLPVLKAHNHDVVFGLSTTQEYDQITQELKQNCDHWIDLQHQGSIDVARQISELQIDILVELGFTSQSPIEVFVHKPAPIQLSYLSVRTNLPSIY